MTERSELFVTVKKLDLPTVRKLGWIYHHPQEHLLWIIRDRDQALVDRVQVGNEQMAIVSMVFSFKKLVCDQEERQ